MAAIGLYYPYVEFHSDAWLKLTALYWDQMARIVPAWRGGKFPLDDSPVVRTLADDAGFVLDVMPGRSDLGVVDTALREVIARHGDALAATYGIARSAAWPDHADTVENEPGGDPKLAYVYPTKVEQGLADAMIACGLAAYGPSRPDVGLGMHPRLANTYMVALAREMGRRRGYSPVTDQMVDHVAVAACTVEDLTDALLGEIELVAAPDRQRGAQDYLVQLAIETVLPGGLEAVPVEKIIAVRDSCDGERRAFNAEIERLMKQLGALASVEDDAARAQHVRTAFNAGIAEPLDNLRRALERNKVATLKGALSVSTVIPAASVAAKLVGVLAAPWLVAPIAVGLGAYQLLRKHGAQRAQLMTAPTAYLLRLEQLTSPQELEAELQGRASRFAMRA